MLWIKCFHLLFVIAWMAGVFYLPRIFVHYVEGRAAGEDVRRLVIMAGRLFGFMTIMAAIAIVLGATLWGSFADAYVGAGWLRLKMVFVALLVAYHVACGRLLRRMRAGESLPGGLALRILNEGALLILIPILILAVVKPF
jgi:protoporphyrinogen IX oxidase